MLEINDVNLTFNSGTAQEVNALKHINLSIEKGSFTLLLDEGSSPILILDDIFAELDTARRAQLVAITHLAEQTFITAAVESDLPADLVTQRFYVTPGKVSSEAGVL